MADLTSVHQIKKIYLNWVPDVFFHPRKAFQNITAHINPIWLTPLLILSIVVLINVIVVGHLKSQSALMGEITYPPDFQYYSPEQQAQYTQAIQSTQGPVFVYVLPAISSLLGVWFSWLILGGILHLSTTLFGGRGSTALSMNIVAWASLPLALREVVQIIYVLITKNMINSPGLSGFALLDDTGGSLLVNQILRLIDIYLFWQILLLILGVRLSTGLNKTKATFDAIIPVLFILLLQIGLSYLISMLSDLTITRPFFF
jgi:hypothetical protein